ncbi:hypothetical protein N7467_004425 [Penicillium canescens]|nr:hypothetical protein N7467_004425 [Penicillium canescens]
MVGSHQSEYVWGPAEEAFSRQVGSGHLPTNKLLSPPDVEGSLIRTTNVAPLLVDYNFDFAVVIYDYLVHSGNDTFVEKLWPRMVMVMSYAMSTALDQKTQLYGAVYGAVYGAPYGTMGTPLSGEKEQALDPAHTVSMILALERMAEVAPYIGDNAVANMCQAQAQLSRTAIDTLLWNETVGYYAATLGGTGYGLMDIAQVLLGGIGSEQRQASFVEILSALRVPAGYINGTRFFDIPSIVDAYYTRFLLEGLASTNRTQVAQDLDATWTPMVRRDHNYTGGYWEYVSTYGTYPGLDLFTGMSHFSGSYPTVFLSEYVLGIRPTKPGYSTFLFAPLPGFKTEWVDGRVP